MIITSIVAAGVVATATPAHVTTVEARTAYSVSVSPTALPTVEKPAQVKTVTLAYSADDGHDGCPWRYQTT